MKKWMIAVLISVFAITASLYVFIPNTIVIQESVVAAVGRQAIFRLLIENGNWNKGWPDGDTSYIKKDTAQSVYLNGYSYSLIDRKYASLVVAIHRGDDTIATSSLNIIPVSKGSVTLDWGALVPTSYNPLKRLKIYQESKKIEHDMGTLLHKMETFFSKTENVYGISIRQVQVVDSTLLSTYDSSKGFPDTHFIYSLIDKLKNYIASQDAAITGYPMLNIYTKDSVIYLTRVALPVNKKLPPSGKMAYKWMLPGGNILITEVKGDSKKIDSAFRQMDFFIKDYERNAAAIPFLSLVTDRLKETDSTKWITRIYFPVME